MKKQQISAAARRAAETAAAAATARARAAKAAGKAPPARKGRAAPAAPARKGKAPAPAAPARAARPMNFTLPFRGSVKPPRPGSKRARVLEMLTRKGGATHADVMREIGWDRVTAYEGIRLLSVHNGYGLTDTGGRITAYAAAPARAAKKAPAAPAAPARKARARA